MNETKANGKPMSLYEIEDNIHGIIADILACLVGRFPLAAERRSKSGLEAWRPTGKNRSCLVIWTVAPSVYRLGFNPQAFSVRALSQTEDDIGSMLLDGVEKLRLAKFDREDDFLASGAAG